jgi:hypothetical protein
MDDVKNESPSLLRHRWLEAALHDLRTYFDDTGYKVPAKLHVSIGWPVGRKAIGQCWYAEGSADKHHEIFVSPAMDDGARIIDILVHEIVHTLAGPKAKHGAAFKAIALKVGLQGKMTATTATDELASWAKHFISRHGKYPAGSLSREHGRKKQGTRLIKCACGECGYTVRVTNKWLCDAGEPTCGHPSHGRMEVED